MELACGCRPRNGLKLLQHAPRSSPHHAACARRHSCRAVQQSVDEHTLSSRDSVGSSFGDESNANDAAASGGWSATASKWPANLMLTPHTGTCGPGGARPCLSRLSTGTTSTTLHVLLVAEWKRAVDSGVSPELQQRYAELQESMLAPLLRFQGFEERLLADPSFMVKVGIEVSQ